MGFFERKVEEQVTKEMSIVRILSLYPLAREVIKRNGIEFIGKGLSPFESLDVVGRGNGLSEERIESVVQELNKGIEEKTKALFEGELIRLTEPAAVYLNRLLGQRGKRGIRLRLASDGCGLYSYDMDFATKKLSDELEFKASGVTLFLEKKTIGLLKGTTIDYQEGFLFKNPNVKS